MSPFNRLLERMARHQTANDRSFVDDPYRGRRLMVRDAALALIAFGAIGIIGAHGPPLPGRLALLVLALFVVLSWFGAVRRAIAYKSGWLDGRMRMLTALVEAERRGMTETEWVTVELAHDYVVMGIPPHLAGHMADEIIETHKADAVCEHGTLHRWGCPACETDDGRSPHGALNIECPTPDECALGMGHPR